MPFNRHLIGQSTLRTRWCKMEERVQRAKLWFSVILEVSDLRINTVGSVCIRP